MTLFARTSANCVFLFVNKFASRRWRRTTMIKWWFRILRTCDTHTLFRFGLRFAIDRTLLINLICSNFQLQAINLHSKRRSHVFDLFWIALTHVLRRICRHTDQWLFRMEYVCGIICWYVIWIVDSLTTPYTWSSEWHGNVICGRVWRRLD